MVFFTGYWLDEDSIYHQKSGYSILDFNGNEKVRKYFSENYRISFLHYIEPFPGGGYMLSIYESNSGNGIPFEYPLTVKRLDDTFGIIWQKIMPFEEAAAGRFFYDNDHNIFMTWDEDPSSPNTGSPWGSPSIISWDENGNFRWKHTFDDNPRNRGLGNIITTSNGQIVATGLDERGLPPLTWGWLVSLDTDGNLLWDRKYTVDEISPNFGGFFGGLIESSDHDLVVAGYIHDKYPLDKFAARDNVWLLKLGLDGCIENQPCDDYTVLTKVEDILSNASSSYSLSPNPVQNILKIEFPDFGKREIEIYSIDGLLLLYKSSVDVLELINVGDFSSGLYFVRIMDRNRKESATSRFMKL